MPTTQTVKTTDREEIKQWINKRGGVPARLGLDSTGINNDPLTVWFREEKQDVPQNFQELDWEEYFSIMDHYKIAFSYEVNGADDRYFRFVNR